MNSRHVLPKCYNNIIQVRNNIVPIVIRDDYLLYGIQRAMGTQGVSKSRIIESYMYHTLVSTRYCRAKSTILYSSIWYTIYLPENINRRVLCKYIILCFEIWEFVPVNILMYYLLTYKSCILFENDSNIYNLMVAIKYKISHHYHFYSKCHAQEL